MQIRPELKRKLLWMIAIRLGIITVFLGWAIVGELRAAPLATSGLFALLGVTYALSVLYAATVGLAGQHGWMVDVQLAADALLVSAFVAVTGGVTSYFSSLYVLPIIAAAVVHSRRSAFVIGLLAAALYTGLVVLQYATPVAGSGLYWIHSGVVDLPGARAAVYTVALNVFGLVAVAFLIGSLAERLAVADASLERASTELAHLQALNQDVIDSLTSGLVTTDYAGRVLTCNRAAEAITGQGATTVVGRHVADVLQLPGSLVAALQRDLNGTRSWREEFTYRTGDDRVVEIGLSVVHLVTPTGRAGFLFNFQDISRVRKMQRDAQLQNRLAAVGEMAAGIAHEIRNPLASISGSIQILRQELRLNQEQRELMDIVLRESERLNQTISGFLAYARPQRFQIKRLDLGSLLRDAALLLGNSAEVQPGHSIVVETPPTEVVYEADEGQVRQIIWNLATNALKAMPNGGRLTLAARHQPSRDAGGAPITGTDDAVLVVEDEGIGIAPEELDRIFQPFHGTFAGGSGLGLSIVHRIVRDYDGEVRVTSKPGAGTRVLVRLPARTTVVAA